MEDFVGFTYNGKHSIRDLKIYRTSNGSRYDENMTATMTDLTADVPGGDGQYYFGTTFKNRTFQINFAFDNLYEEDIAKIKQTFRGDGIHDLVFDETPYKAWSAKVTGTATLKHLCFEEKYLDSFSKTEKIRRVYMGEGNVTFTCYYPYAHTPDKLWTVTNKGTSTEQWTYSKSDGNNINNYSIEAYPNKEEWSDAANLDVINSYVGSFVAGGFPNIKGDRKIPYKFYLKSKVNGLEITHFQLTIATSSQLLDWINNPTFKILPASSTTLQTNEEIIFDSKTALLYKQTSTTKVIIPYTIEGAFTNVLQPGDVVAVHYITNPALSSTPTPYEGEFQYNFEYL